MKPYFRPQVQITKFHLHHQLASLNDWLSTNQLTDAGITTYIINS